MFESDDSSCVGTRTQCFIFFMFWVSPYSKCKRVKNRFEYDLHMLNPRVIFLWRDANFTQFFDIFISLPGGGHFLTSLHNTTHPSLYFRERKRESWKERRRREKKEGATIGDLRFYLPFSFSMFSIVVFYLLLSWEARNLI